MLLVQYFSNLTRIAFTIKILVSNTISVTVPIAPFVKPSLTSIFFVIITLAPTLRFIIILKFAMSHSGLSENWTFAKFIDTSFFPSIAGIMNSCPESICIFIYHTYTGINHRHYVM